MKKFAIPALILLAALFAAGCDRFPHDFEPPDVVDFNLELFTPLNQALQEQPAAGIEAVMDFFAEDYIHFGINKADRRVWLEGIFQAQPTAVAGATLLASDQLSDSTAVANWKLTITDSKGVIVDSTFTGENLAKREGHWLLRGNQNSCTPPVVKQRVIIEYFTFLGCPNCPEVEAELHDLQLAYPGQLSYLEHHVSGPLTVSGDETYAYYGPFSVPTSILGGEVMLTGSSADIISSYEPEVQTLANLDSVFEYTNLSFSVDGQTISGSLNLNLLSEPFQQQDLVLNCVLIERESSFNNTQGQPLRNVVRAKSVQSIGALDLSEPVSFSLTSSVPIPDDASLVIFAQNKPVIFGNNASIYGGIEVALDR
ncbi:MAG: hypothetical protein PHD87_08555 [Candidatus Cloacimonetes bacterium]|nr:hypothetical protein [Candidatus Cloacimonadota bacterium]